MLNALTSITFYWWSIKDTLGERVIGNLRAGLVVFRVLCVSWCHACMLDALTRITFY
jgi:hypothetical protein